MFGNSGTTTESARRDQTRSFVIKQLTYDPPPVLAQTSFTAPGPVDDSPTVRFRRPGQLPAAEPNEYSSPWLSGAADVTENPRPEWLSEPAPPPRPPPRNMREAWAWRSGVALLALLVPLAIADVPWVARPGRPAVTASAGSVSLGDVRAPAQCAVPSMADQRACLLELVAASDAPLQLVYDSLVAETRRHASIPPGGVEPLAVAQLRAEQQRWVADREWNCTRDPAPGFVPRWAKPISTCFARMATARRDELSSKLERARRGPR